MKRVRVLLADDHKIVAEGLRSLLQQEFVLVGVVEDGYALIEEEKRLEPDVIVADITMPLLNGIEATRKLKKGGSKAKIVILTMHSDATYARRALDAGASAFVLKHSAPSQLVEAIRAVLGGGTYITPTIERSLLESNDRKPSNSMDRLTPRQREVLQLLAEGHSAKEIARILHISPRTAEFHKYQMMGALGIGSTVDLIRFALTHGILPEK